MTVTKDYTRNFDEDARNVVGPLLDKGDPTAYIKVASGCNGSRPYLDNAIYDLVERLGFSGKRILDGFEKVYVESEKERMALGSKVVLDVGGIARDVTSTDEGNTPEEFYAFAEDMTGLDQALGFAVGEKGVKGEGRLPSDYETAGLVTSDNLFDGLQGLLDADPDFDLSKK